LWATVVDAAEDVGPPQAAEVTGDFVGEATVAVAADTVGLFLEIGGAADVVLVDAVAVAVGSGTAAVTDD